MQLLPLYPSIVICTISVRKMTPRKSQAGGSIDDDMYGIVIASYSNVLIINSLYRSQKCLDAFQCNTFSRDSVEARVPSLAKISCRPYYASSSLQRFAFFPVRNDLGEMQKKLNPPFENPFDASAVEAEEDGLAMTEGAVGPRLKERIVLS